MPAAAASERMIQRAVPFSSASPPNAAVQASLSTISPVMAELVVTLTRSLKMVAAGFTASVISLTDWNMGVRLPRSGWVFYNLFCGRNTERRELELLHHDPANRRRHHLVQRQRRLRRHHI